MEKVSANTITQLTAEAAGLKGELPTTAQMIEDIRGEFNRKLQSLGKLMHQSGRKRNSFHHAHARISDELKEFESIIVRVPNGFRLAPVWYTRGVSSQNKVLEPEFHAIVRPAFLRYLAANHTAELSALGMCEKGIEQLSKGLDPIDSTGRLYAVNVDHIIERAGGGVISATEHAEIDPLMPQGSGPTHRINHFSNLILMPIHVHEIKNSLNHLQFRLKKNGPDIKEGESIWMLMLVPETGPEHTGYVAQPQGNGLQTASPKLRVQHTSSLELAVSTSRQAQNFLEGHLLNPQQKEFLPPVLDELAGRLTAAFNDAFKPRGDIKAFRRFYEGDSFTYLRKGTQILPAEDRKKLDKAMQQIDCGIAVRFQERAKKKANSGGKKSYPSRSERQRARHHG